MGHITNIGGIGHMKERKLDNLHDSIEHYLNIAGQKIVQRGRAYYRDGNIRFLSLLENGNFEAEVEGSGDTYNVSVSVDRNNKISRCNCDCPYEYGSVCKHTAAVLMAIRDGQFQKKTRSVGKPADFMEVILHADEAKLRQFVADYAEQDETFRNRLLAGLGSLQEDRIFVEIQRKLDKAVRSFESANYRYADTAELDFSNTVEEVLDDAEEYAKNGYNVLAFKSAVCVIRSVVRIVDEMYECNNDVYCALHRAAELLVPSADTVMEAGSEQEQKEICGYGLSEAEHCGEWCDDILRALIPAGVKWMPVQLEKRIERFASDGTLSLDFCLEYIRTVKGETEYERFLASHLGIDRVRKIAIDRETERGNYTKAETLCLDRLEGEEVPYNRREWLRLLYGIYEKAQNTDKMTATAKQLLLLGEDKYYDILKHLLHQSGKWEELYESLMDELGEKLPSYQYDEILLKEREYRVLLDRIETTDGNAIFRYGPQIAKEYPEEAAMVYRAKIEEMAECAADRNRYQEICRYLKELAAFGGTDMIQMIITDFRFKYKRRPAFMEELTELEEEL